MNIKEEQAYMKIVEEIGDWNPMPEEYMYNPQKVIQVKKTRRRLLEFFGKEQIIGKIEIGPSPTKFGDVIISFRMKDFIVWDMNVFSYVSEYLSDYGIFTSKFGNLIFSATIEKVAINLTAYDDLISYDDG